MLAEPVEVVELSEGLAPGFVVLILLAGCCLCGILAGGFYAGHSDSLHFNSIILFNLYPI